ncbi:MAG: 4-(cytidine 5'-diphospho)-2-C-methyl-D-erythritol kinase [Thermodesulfobacteriota bacterium]
MSDCPILYAPAKINLFLKVTGERPDGYHSLFTLFQKVTLFDHIIIRKAEKGINLSCPEGTVPEDETNIAYQAASFFYKITGLSPGVDIEIRKNIPVAAGLGGGSSDAACVLKGLQELYGNPCTRDEVSSIGSKLGADVPFFFEPCTMAVGRGIGDQLEPIPSPSPLWFVLISPCFPVSTKWVYENLKLTTRENLFIFSPEDVVNIERFLHNDLEEVTASQYPVIHIMKEYLLSYGAEGALMTGSGPTVFGLFKDEGKARLARERLASNTDWAVYLVRSL